MNLGLRIDVDTLRGTKIGVPNLLRTLDAHSISASFFFSVGPDNMGRHLWRLLKPKFLIKMLRTKAASLYGWDILLRGTFWPGPSISQECADVFKNTAQAGHEIGLHAWDHHLWQTMIDKMSEDEIRSQMRQGVETLTEAAGTPPVSSAAPAWRCSESALKVKSEFPFKYNSDCRGGSIFKPLIKDMPGHQPQVPTTLPTYDELIGKNGVTNENYNERLLSLIKRAGLNVLTIHAEVEGIVCQELFDQFLRQCREKGVRPMPLGSMFNSHTLIEPAFMVNKEIPGREGWVSIEEIL